MVPLRPRLADEVLARLDRRGDTRRLVLLDRRHGRTLVLEGRSWALLGQADGTRDLQGLVAAARGLGVRIGVEPAARLLAQLHALGLLVDGAPDEIHTGVPEPSAWHDDARAIEVWPLARYRCDGRGGCCRVYPSVLVLPDDLHRAAATLPEDHELGHAPQWASTPVCGSAPTVRRTLALVEGACRFHRDGEGCSLHACGGAAAKPLGCRWFPAQLVDDGDALRATVAIECACVAKHDPDGEPLLPPTVVRGADLPRGSVVARVPAQVPVAAGVVRSRSDAIAWLQAVPEDDDVAAAVLRHAAALAPAVDHDAIAVVTAAAARQLPVLSAALARERSWRDPGEPAGERLATLLGAAQLLASPTAAALLLGSAPSDPALERRALAAAQFGRLWLLEGDLHARAIDFAVAVWLARAVAALVPADADATLRETPLAAVLATLRVYAA
ncbi:MAG: YkgJ family cysteine cluster protein [Nannocystaceae bacterium]|nr:YkgJ family cysteine cluster protein [Nannocystaceae bacterium]